MRKFHDNIKGIKKYLYTMPARLKKKYIVEFAIISIISLYINTVGVLLVNNHLGVNVINDYTHIYSIIYYILMIFILISVSTFIKHRTKNFWFNFKSKVGLTSVAITFSLGMLRKYVVNNNFFIDYYDILNPFILALVFTLGIITWGVGVYMAIDDNGPIFGNTHTYYVRNIIGYNQDKNPKLDSYLKYFSSHIYSRNYLSSKAGLYNARLVSLNQTLTPLHIELQDRKDNILDIREYEIIPFSEEYFRREREISIIKARIDIIESDIFAVNRKVDNCNKIIRMIDKRKGQ